jgi:hypothetical protein
VNIVGSRKICFTDDGGQSAICIKEMLDEPVSCEECDQRPEEKIGRWITPEARAFKRHWGFDSNAPHYYDERWDDVEHRKFCEEMGFVRELCPICKAHLVKSGICLNACHLTKHQREKFAEIMHSVVEKGE